MVLPMRYCSVMPAATPSPADFPFLETIAPQSRQRLTGALRSAEFQQGESILKRGDEVSGVYLVKQGALRVYYITPEGKEGTLYWVEPGQSCILALNCTFSRIPYPAWVEADRSRTVVAVIPGEVFRQLFTTEPAIQKFTFDALSLRLFDLMARLEQVSTQAIEQRLAALLLREAADTATVRLSQERIARHLGTAREVVSRSLRSLAARDHIGLAPGHIRIIDADGLRRVADL